LPTRRQTLFNLAVNRLLVQAVSLMYSPKYSELTAKIIPMKHLPILIQSSNNKTIFVDISFTEKDRHSGENQMIKELVRS
jgi:hypothetical protein